MTLIEGEPAASGKIKVVMAIIGENGTIGNVCLLEQEPSEIFRMLNDRELFLDPAIENLKALGDFV